MEDNKIPTREDWEEYKEFKKELEKENLTQDEYKKRIEEYCEEHNL